MINEFDVLSKDEKQRLDIFLSSKLGITRSQIKSYISFVKVNDKDKKLSYIIRKHDNIKVYFENEKLKYSSPKAENIAIDIVYQDNFIVVINKKSGMSVHCSKTETSNTLVNALMYHIKDFDFYGDKMRAGIIHRLDKDTSGIIVVGKNPYIVEKVQEQFKSRTVEKVYHAIVLGNKIEDNFFINLPIGRHHVYRKKMTITESGKEAITYIKVLKRYLGYSLLEVKPKTGRTHQIRVHLAHKGYPIAGDKIYSKSSNKYETLMLHAKKISFVHPITNESTSFEVDYPNHFYKLINSF